MTKSYVLTPEQEAKGLYLIKQGGSHSKQLKEIFVHFNQPLVGSVARHYRDKGLSWEELLAAGNVGLLEAVNRFDISRGYKFSTFAVPWIAGEIKQLFKSTKRHKLSDRNIRQTENGVPLVDGVNEEEVLEDERLKAAIIKDVDAQNEPESEALLDHADLLEAVHQDVESQEEPTTENEWGCEADGGGLGLNARQARSEGIGSVAGCAEFSASLRGEDPSYDGKPGGGYAINLAPDWSMCETGADDIRPVLEQAIQRLKDPRHIKVMTMHLGLFGNKQHTFAEIGQVLDVTAQRAHAIHKEALMQLSNDPTLEMFFDLIT